MKRCQFKMSLAYAIAPTTLLTVLPCGWLLYQGGSLSAETFLTCIILSLSIVGPLIAAMGFIDNLAKISTTVADVDELLRGEEQRHGETQAKLGVGMVSCLLLQILLHHISDRLQSAAGYMVFADMRIKLGQHLRRMPMGYFTEGNIGKISSMLSSDMVFIEENCMMVLADMMSYLFAQAVMIVFLLPWYSSGSACFRTPFTTIFPWDARTLPDGSIAQAGTHEALIEKDGIYRSFVTVRENSRGWSRRSAG